MRPSGVAAHRRAGRTRPAVVLALLGVALATASVLPPRPAAPAAVAPPAHDVLANLPLAFEPAEGGGFVSKGPGWSLSLTASEAVLGVHGGSFTLRPAGGIAAALVPSQPLGASVNRLTGDDPARWRTGLGTYGRIDARQVWPGVDMVWHGDQRRIEHDMVVAPGVDPAVVALDVEGAASLTVDPGGDLVVDLGGATARLARPVAYQDVAGTRRQVAAGFTLLGPARIGFQLGAYDRSLPLVVDPTLVTSTFLGGSGLDSGYALAVDTQGNSYVTGSTESTDFPTGSAAQPGLSNAAGGPTSDVFVSKLSPDGSRLVWSTYLGGRGRDTGYSIAVAPDGTVYVAGVTESADFPHARAAQDAYGGGASDAFVARLAANGASVDWSTFVGGTQADRARGVALDSGGNAYVTGSTSSSDFPAVNPHQPGPFRADDLDAFLVKVPAAGGPFTFATRLGGGNDDRGLAVAVDGAGNAYVTGDTLSPGFPTVRPIQAASGGSAGGVAGSFPDAFVSKFNSAGSALVYSTFLGGGDFDQGTAIAVDAEGAAYVAGNTNSPNFPTVNPLQAAKGNDADAFVAKIDPPGAALVYSTYLGGNGADGANGIAVDRSGNAHVVGTTGSANYPTVRPTQGNRGGADDAFVLKLNNTGRAALFSTFLGGREADAGMGVGVDGPGTIRVLGLTGSADFPSVKPFQGARPPAGGDAFVADLDPGEAAGPAASPTTSGAGAAAASSSASSSTGHDRRVRLLGALTLVLLLAAVLQTMFLRRRPPVPAGRRPGPAPKPSAAPGLRVLDDTGAGAAKKAAVAKATAASKASRAPKARGGPKGGPQRAGGAQKAGNRKTPARPRAGAVAGAGADVAGGADDGGRPTEASPAVPKTKPQAPAIAQLLEEDLWAPEPPAAPAPDEVEVVAAAPTEPDVPAPSPEVQGQAGPEPRPEPEPEPAAFIPPVPAEELSFWDLFPEDLPPARAASFPAEDLLADLALPEGPDSAAGRLLPAPAPEPSPVEGAATQEPRPPRPPEAEIVIAELLDGPVPTGLRATPESPWAPPGGDDLVISELLVNQPSGAPPGDSPDSPDGDDPDDDETAASAMAGRSREEQARIAADQARRRRSRRSGRGRRPGSG